MSLTDQLVDALNFAGEEDNDLNKKKDASLTVSSAPSGISAAKELINAKKQQAEMLEDIVLFNVNAKKPQPRFDPFVQQISDSGDTTAAPTYWKTPKVKGPKPISNATKKKREKGEAYQDKLNEKFISKGHRAQRMNNMKSMY